MGRKGLQREHRINRQGEKRYVKTILFSARADSLAMRMHVVTKVMLLIVLSVAVIEAMTRPAPDILFSLLILAVVVAMLAEARVLRYVFRSYVALLLLALFVLFLWWLVFNQVGGTMLLSVKLFGMQLNVTNISLATALSRVAGYAAMAFLTLFLLMTTRDAEVVSAMSGLKLPFKVVFFFSLILRSFNSMQGDFESIRQAQFSRGANVTSKNLVTRARDFVSLSIPLTASMIKRSVDMGAALEARGFGKAKRISGFVTAKRFGYADAAAVALSFVALAIAYSVNLTVMSGMASGFL